MDGDNGKGLSIECCPTGAERTATLTARLGEEVLAVESVNLAKRNLRDAFAETVCDGRPGIDRKALDAELLRLAADLTNKPEGEPAPSLGELPEIDTACIVRPERFIVPEVSGLAVPTMTEMGDKPVRRFLLYMQWPDGRRERRLDHDDDRTA